MAYSYDSHSYQPSRSKHDSFLQPSSAHDAYGYSRKSRSSTRLGVPETPITRNKSVGERERRPYGAQEDHRSRSSVRREETYPSFSTRNKSAHRRRSWPPPASVEDEDEALDKEFPRRRRRKQSDDEVSMPGTVDQNPLMIELESPDRRFVVVPQDETKKARPDARPRRRSNRDQPAPLKVDVDRVDPLARRPPAPYGFSKPSLSIPKPNGSSSGSSSSDPSRAASLASEDEYRRGSRQSRTPHSSSDERQSDGSDLEPSAVRRLRERKQKPRVSFHEPSMSSPSRPEMKRFSSDYTSPSDPRPKAAAPSLLKKSVLNKADSALSSDDEGGRRRREGMPSSVPRSTPTTTSMPPTPQHVRTSSGLGIRPSAQDLVNSSKHPETRSTYPLPSTRSSDRTSSGDFYGSDRRSSRPSSPAMSNFDLRGITSSAPRSNGYPDDAAYPRQTPITPRPGGDSRQNSWDRSSGPIRNDVPPPPAALPYPVDDFPMMQMPNHEHYIDTPTRETPPALPKRSDLPSNGYTASPKTSPHLGVIAGEFPMRPRARSNTDTKRPSVATPASGTSTTPLPPCPRMEWSKKYVDWYTLRGDSSIDICPACYDGIIRPTPFRLEFVSAPMRSSTVSTRCDMGSAWYRAAWLLTQKRQRQDLDLLYALSAINTVAGSCPGNREHEGPWYGLFGDGQPISGFSVCSRDFRFIEAIFPSLIGLFHRIPASSTGRDAKMCSMRLPGEKFSDYLNLFEKIDEEARKSPLKSSASLQQLIKFIRASNIPPPPLGPPPPAKSTPKKSVCQKDAPIVDGTWHFMPLLPEFTVCASCFDEVVWPRIKAGNELAVEFHQVLTPLPAGVRTKGTSCQLYSPRMRRIFARAAEEGEREGCKLLGRKVRHRKEIEDELKAEQQKVDRKLDRNKHNVGRLAEDIREECRRSLERIEREWQDWE